MFRERFPKGKVFLPVVHAQSYDQVYYNCCTAAESNADGVFLISHGGTSNDELFLWSTQIKEEFNFFTGINCLGLSNNEVIQHYGPSVDGIWVDNANILELADQQLEAKQTRELHYKHCPTTLYFGGVAFKYQRKISGSDLDLATIKARPYVDVITTSGVGTGKAADLYKIKLMYLNKRETPLAVASGITLENIKNYLPYVDAFLVATGISNDFYNLDYKKTKAMSDIIKESEQSSDGVHISDTEYNSVK